MKALVPLEKIYQQEEVIPESEYIREDLFHIYTHILYTQMAEKIKDSKGITHIAKRSIYDCILTYSINLAKLMQETHILEIDENLLDEHLFFTEKGSTADQVNLILSSDQFYAYKRYFAKKYNPQLFKNNDDYKQHKYGYQGCPFVYTYGIMGNLSYAFSHKEFLNYFCTFDSLRRKKIRTLMDSTQGNPPQLWSRQSSVKGSVSLRSRRSSDDQEDYYKGHSPLPSRRSSITSTREDASKPPRSRHSSDQTHQASFFSISGGGRGKVSYLSHAAGHDTSAIGTHTIDPITDHGVEALHL